MNASQISGKNVVENFTAFDLIDNDVLWHCASCFFIFFQRPKCVACCFVYDRISIIQFFLLQTCAWPFPNLFWKIINQNCSKVINMPLWSTHKIKLLIREIEERQCLWNILNHEYNDKVKKLDAWKEVSEVLDRDQMEISFCSLFINN